MDKQKEIDYVHFYETLHQKIIDQRKILTELNLSVDQLLDIASTNIVKAELLDNYLNHEFANLIDRILSIVIPNISNEQREVFSAKIIAQIRTDLGKAADDQAKLEAKKRSKTGKDAADKRHEENRYKHEKIKEIWSTGKYSSRDICAEEEADALGMSISTARKALRNTPSPSRC